MGEARPGTNYGGETMKRVIASLILGLTVTLCVVVCVIPQTTRITQADQGAVEEPELELEYEQIEVENGIIFREVHTGEEIFFEYTTPVSASEDEAAQVGEYHITDPNDPYYIIEVPLEQDPKKRSTREICEEVAELYPRISAEDLEAMCIQESRCNPDAFNGVCRGIIQVAKKWHSDRMERLNVEDLSDPYGCVLVAADFLNELYDIADTYANGDFAYVLMRYNMTIESANYWYDQGVISEYAQNVIKMSNELKEAHGYEE